MVRKFVHYFLSHHIVHISRDKTIPSKKEIQTCNAVLTLNITLHFERELLLFILFKV